MKTTIEVQMINLDGPAILGLLMSRDQRSIKSQ